MTKAQRAANRIIEISDDEDDDNGNGDKSQVSSLSALLSMDWTKIQKIQRPSIYIVTISSSQFNINCHLFAIRLHYISRV